MNLKVALSRTLLRRAAPFRRQINGRFPGNAWMGWNFLALEDGWIRSLGLGDDPQIYSLIVDDRGIYYDATRPSRLESLLAEYDFGVAPTLLEEAEEAMELIRRHRIAKYNHAPFLRESEARKIFGRSGKDRVLIVAQTEGDASLEYGLADEPTPALIRRAMEENPDARIYLKIHPDVLAGLKNSDIDPEALPPGCTVIREDCNPYSLLERVDRVYTKTSGMGMEALILGKEVHCSGLPWYAGWGVTHDRCASPRRGRRRTVPELFAASYLLYPFYYDPFLKREASLSEVIDSIRRRKERK